MAYYPLRIDNNRIIQTQLERIVFDYDQSYNSSCVHLYANKVWCSLMTSGFKYQVSYFDLSKRRPVEVPFASFSVIYFIEDNFLCLGEGFPLMQWVGNNLVMYTDEKELSFLNLDSGNWSTVANRYQK